MGCQFILTIYIKMYPASASLYSQRTVLLFLETWNLRVGRWMRLRDCCLHGNKQGEGLLSSWVTPSAFWPWESLQLRSCFLFFFWYIRQRPNCAHSQAKMHFFEFKLLFISLYVEVVLLKLFFRCSQMEKSHSFPSTSPVSKQTVPINCSMTAKDPLEVLYMANVFDLMKQHGTPLILGPG